MQRRQSGRRIDTRAPWPKGTELEVSSFPLQAREMSPPGRGNLGPDVQRCPLTHDPVSSS